jgi:hypothetical protein
MSIGNFTVTINDTLAFVNFADNQIVVSKSGIVSVITEYGMLPLQRK